MRKALLFLLGMGISAIVVVGPLSLLASFTPAPAPPRTFRVLFTMGDNKSQTVDVKANEMSLTQGGSMDTCLEFRTASRVTSVVCGVRLAGVIE